MVVVRRTPRLLALVGIAACACIAVTGKYDAKQFADWPIAPDKKIDGCALVRTTAEEDAFVYRGRPSGSLGSGVTLELPLGLLTREAARRVFGDLFLAGVPASPTGPAHGACPVSIFPRPTRFDWKYRGLSSVELTVSVAVSTQDATGRVILERTYDARPVEAGAPQRDAAAVAATAHVVLQALMLRAAADVKAQLEGAAPASGSASTRD